MPGNSITEALNGATVIHGNTTPTEPGKRDRYRPDASTRAVHEEVLRSLATVVTTALSNAGHFVYLADVYDRDDTTAVKLGHLVDATECAEIAMTHLGQLKTAMNHRLRTEDAQYIGEQDTGESPF